MFLGQLYELLVESGMAVRMLVAFQLPLMRHAFVPLMELYRAVVMKAVNEDVADVATALYTAVNFVQASL